MDGVSEERFINFEEVIYKFREESGRERGELKTAISNLNSDITEIKSGLAYCHQCSNLLAVHDQKINIHCTDISNLKRTAEKNSTDIAIHKVLFGLIGSAMFVLAGWASGLINKIFQ